MVSPAQVELTHSEQPDLVTDGRYRRASLPKRRLTFVSEEDAQFSAPSAGRRDNGPSATGDDRGGEHPSGFRTASWEALARWDDPGSRRGSERDLLEALLGTAVGPGDDVSAVPPPQDPMGALVRRWAEAVGSGAVPVTGLEAPPLPRPSQGCMTDVQPGRSQLSPPHAGGLALLSAPHVSRLASLLTAAPAAPPMLLPMLTNSTARSCGQGVADQVCMEDACMCKLCAPDCLKQAGAARCG